MKTATYTHGFRVHHHPAGHPRDYGKLHVDIFPIEPVTYKAYPVPVFDRTRYPDTTVTLRWQRNGTECREGTTIPEWYGFHLELETDEIDARAFTSLAWVRRLLKDCGEKPDPIAVLDALTDSRAAAYLEYFGTFSNFVRATDWSTAMQYTAYAESGIKPDGSGVCVHAYVRDYEDPAEKVAAALRDSSYCTDQQFAEWVLAGKPVQRLTGFYRPDRWPVNLNHVTRGQGSPTLQPDHPLAAAA